MNYKAFRPHAKDGDVLMVEGRGWVSRIIRAVTGQQISHVALLLWFGEHLFVAEMKEFRGYRLIPASMWFEDTVRTGYVQWGRAPQGVRGKAGVKAHALKYRNARYSYRALLRVWLAQITRSKTDAGLVCSTFVQRVWESVGHTFDQDADPGDYMRLCDRKDNVTP